MNVTQTMIPDKIRSTTTVLYVSHSLESIRELCTKVVWLEHGTMKMIGDPDTICDTYYRFQMGEPIDMKKSKKDNKRKKQDK